MVPLWHYLVLSVILFGIGIFGVLVRRNLIVIMMSVELMLNAVNLAFITFARMHGGVEGQVIAFLVIVLAAAEAAVGLAILVALRRMADSVNVDDWNLLRG
jgi:NADH-quinone oxidoreductase subunit K